MTNQTENPIHQPPEKCTIMIEKVALSSLSTEIMTLCGIKYDSFTLKAGQEIDTGWKPVGGYGIYMLYSGDMGLAALFIQGSYPNGLVAFNGYSRDSNICGDIGSGAQIEFGLKSSNSNIFIKNNRDTAVGIRVKRYLEYKQ